MAKRFQFIREKRNEKKLTIEQLAEKADVSIDLVARLERGDREDISVVKLEKILNALELQLGDVFDHSSLDKKSNKFLNKFFKMSADNQETYADIFLKIISLEDKIK